MQVRSGYLAQMVSRVVSKVFGSANCVLRLSEVLEIPRHQSTGWFATIVKAQRLGTTPRSTESVALQFHIPFVVSPTLLTGFIVIVAVLSIARKRCWWLQ